MNASGTGQILSTETWSSRPDLVFKAASDDDKILLDSSCEQNVGNTSIYFWRISVLEILITALLSNPHYCTRSFVSMLAEWSNVQTGLIYTATHPATSTRGALFRVSRGIRTGEQLEPHPSPSQCARFSTGQSADVLPAGPHAVTLALRFQDRRG